MTSGNVRRSERGEPVKFRAAPSKGNTVTNSVSDAKMSGGGRRGEGENDHTDGSKRIRTEEERESEDGCDEGSENEPDVSMVQRSEER